MSNDIDHPHQWFGGRTYAQHGDDLVVLNIFKRLHIEQPTYLDIGAHHPFDLSNTALMHKRGSKGINVEANPDLIKLFHVERPNDVNIHALVVGKQTNDHEILYRMSKTSGLNSMFPQNLREHGIVDSVEVPAMTADHIIEKYADGKWPNFVSIDAEGADFEIIQGINTWTNINRPFVVCIEAVSSGPRRDE